MIGRYVVSGDTFRRISRIEVVGEVKVRIGRGELKFKAADHEVAAYVLVPPQAIKCHRVDEAGARTIARGSFLKVLKLLRDDQDVVMSFEENVVVFEVDKANYTVQMYANGGEFESFDPPILPKYPAKVTLERFTNAVDAARRVDDYVELVLRENSLDLSAKNELIRLWLSVPAEYDGEECVVHASAKALERALSCLMDGLVSLKVGDNLIELSQSDELGVETVVRLRGVVTCHSLSPNSREDVRRLS